MLKIIIASLITKNMKYAAAQKIQGCWVGLYGDGQANLYNGYD